MILTNIRNTCKYEITEFLGKVFVKNTYSYHCAVAGDSNSLGSYTHLDQMLNTI